MPMVSAWNGRSCQTQGDLRRRHRHPCRPQFAVETRPNDLQGLCRGDGRLRTEPPQRCLQPHRHCRPLSWRQRNGRRRNLALRCRPLRREAPRFVSLRRKSGDDGRMGRCRTPGHQSADRKHILHLPYTIALPSGICPQRRRTFRPNLERSAVGAVQRIFLRTGRQVRPIPRRRLGLLD